MRFLSVYKRLWLALALALIFGLVPTWGHAQTVTLSSPSSSSTNVNTITTLFTISEPTGTPQQIQVVFTCTSGACLTSNATVITLTMKANTPAPGSFTVSATNLYSVANAFTAVTSPTAGQQMGEGYYSVYTKYIRPAAAGGTTLQSTVRTGVYVDTVTLPPILTSPAASTRYASPVAFSYTLSELYLSGSASIVLSGPTTVTLTLVDNLLSGSFSLNTSAITTNSVIAATTASTLPDGLYSVTLSYRDRFGHNPATATSTNVLIVNALYGVSYSANGATGGVVPSDANSYGGGESATVLANTGALVRTGYSFAGWNTAPDGSGTTYAASGAALAPLNSANLVLYAQWTINAYSLSYAGNGNTGGTAPVDAGSPYAFNSTVLVAGAGTLTKTGNNFAGWNTQPNGSGTAYATGSSIPNYGANTVLYAQWTTSTNPVTYVGNGNTGGNAPVDGNSPYTYGAYAATLPAGTLVRTGYRFTGWNSAADGSGTAYAVGAFVPNLVAPTVLYAQWTGNPVNALVLDAATPTTLYEGLDGSGVFKSLDNGGTWTAATTQPANLRIKALVIKPGTSSTLYAATYGAGVVQSSNGGVAWSACANTGLSNLNVVSLVMAADGTMYAGTEAGVFVSSDCASWTARNIGLPN